MNENWGKLHFFLTFMFLNGTFFPMHILGVVGFPRRLADPYHYEHVLGTCMPLNQFMTWCAIVHGRVAGHLRRQLLLQHVLRTARAAAIRGTPTAWNGRPPARRATATSISNRSSTAARTNTARPRSTPTTTRRPSRRRGPTQPPADAPLALADDQPGHERGHGFVLRIDLA